MAKAPVPCEQCPIYQNFVGESPEGFREAASHLVPVVGEAAVERAWESEAEFIEKVRAGVAECPGYTPISNFMRKAVKFFDGQVGINFVEATHCHNPAFQGEEWEQLKAEREQFDQQLKEAAEAIQNPAR